MPATRSAALAAAACLALVAPGRPVARADDPPQAAVPSDPVFVATLTDGSTESGRLLKVDATAGATLAGPAGAERVVPLDRLVKLTREAPAPPVVVEGGTVLLPGGDRLAHCVVGAAGDLDLAVQSVALGKLAVPLDAMAGLVLTPPRDPDAADALEAQVRAPGPAGERLWLANGDRLDGLFAGMTERQVAFRPPTGPVTLPRSGVVALGFDPAQVADHPPKGPHVEWTLLDGSRLALDGTRVDRGQVVGRARFGVEVRIPVGEVARARILGGAVTYLSDREADRAVYESYVGPTRPYRRDASVAGRRLRLGGQSYDRGLGTQSRTLLAYRLPADAKRFQATVGLDDEAGPLGSVVFKVLVDGRPTYQSPDMGAGEAPRAVDVDVAGGKVLILTTEFGQRGDVQDGGDWAEARIIR